MKERKKSYLTVWKFFSTSEQAKIPVYLAQIVNWQYKVAIRHLKLKTCKTIFMFIQKKTQKKGLTTLNPLSFQKKKKKKGKKRKEKTQSIYSP